MEEERKQSRVVLSDESSGLATEAQSKPEDILSSAGVQAAKEVLSTAQDDKLSLELGAEALKAATKVT